MADREGMEKNWGEPLQAHLQNREVASISNGLMAAGQVIQAATGS